MDWDAIENWMPDGYIRSLTSEGRGTGAIRHLVTGWGVHLSERLDRADERSGLLELSLVAPLPWGLLSYRAQGKLDILPGRRCRLTWRGRPEMPERGPDSERVTRLLRNSYAKMFEGIRAVVES